ncbi:universal stress protein [Flavobacterium luteum]|uniref:Universal stress protein n=1 Tax=Flavobacterium luteum TaxID=2026654 RepID=A0A7J5AJG0_9FLAO|nr:universal stress protein [Flavobacterium luteum]KAB1157724.1 universal stress protein [Flavobacterium luteum]
MKRILVTTDFSANSKKGMLFAIQLASQIDCELVFYNVVEIFKPSIWEVIYYNKYEASELKKKQDELELFVHKLYQYSKHKESKYKCVCQVGMNVSNQIIEYAKELNVNYICVSTIGAGKLTQLLGTVASELIAFSPTPLFVIPKNYRSKPIKTIAIESDFKSFNEEFKKVVSLNNALKTKLNVFHYNYEVHLKANKNKINKLIAEHESDAVTFYIRKLNPVLPLRKHLQADIEKMKPSLVVMFTRQNQNWFNRLLLSSISVEMAFYTKIPMLVFKKNTT